MKLISWSLSSRKILVRQDNQYLVLNSNQANYYTKLSEITGVTMENPKWHTLNDNYLYGLNHNSLYRLDIISQTTEKVTADFVLDFQPYGSEVIYLAKSSGQYFLKTDQSGGSQTIFSLPVSGPYLFGLHNSNLSLLDTSQQILYLLKLEDENQPVRAVIKNVTNFEWHNTALVYWNNYELWAYFPESGDKTLLERTSQQIKRAFWHPNAAYVFVILADRLKIYELENREKRNTYDLLVIPDKNENFITTDKKGNNLLMLDEQNGQKGFFEVNIQ